MLLTFNLGGRPPDPWLDRLISFGNMLVFEQQGGQEQMAAAATRQLVATLKVIQGQM